MNNTLSLTCFGLLACMDTTRLVDSSLSGRVFSRDKNVWSRHGEDMIEHRSVALPFLSHYQLCAGSAATTFSTHSVAMQYNFPIPQTAVQQPQAAAEAAINDWSAQQGFNVSKKKRTKNDQGEIFSRLFACDRSGNLKNTQHLGLTERVRPLRNSKRNDENQCSRG